MGTLSMFGIALFVATLIALALLLFVFLARIVDFIITGALLAVAIASGDLIFILVMLALFLLVVTLRIRANRPRARPVRR